MIDLVYFVVIKKAYKTVGISGIGAVVGYFLFWLLINGPLTTPIARVVYKQDKKEGDFRFFFFFFFFQLCFNFEAKFFILS